MTRAVLKFLAAAAAALWFCAASSARAETINDTLEAFGFFGSWAIDCSTPASPSNNHRSALITLSGNPIFIESLGPDSEPNVYTVLRAARNDDTVKLGIKLNSETEQDVSMRMAKGRLRTMTTRGVDGGKYLVRNGVVTSNGRRTPWLTRCGTP